uniref:Nop domain-containing protein n=1 Tax=Palpitomonas bilix TaxID=652834 RepID=A0A7S3D0X4_9EUKA
MDLTEGAEGNDKVTTEAEGLAEGDDVSRIWKSKRMQEHIKRLDRIEAITGGQESSAPDMEDLEYRCIYDSMSLTVDIDTEIGILHKHIRDLYAEKFPELESLILHPLDYARVVKRIGNEMDATLIDLGDILPSATAMIVTVTASTTAGKPLAEEKLENVFKACEEAMRLDELKQRMHTFVQNRMESLAPNLSALLGTGLAARVMGAAGGLMSLSRIPSCNVLMLGVKRKTLGGLSSKAARPNEGLVSTSDIVTSAPPDIRQKAARQLAGKVTLAARVDANKTDSTGEVGRKFKEVVEQKNRKVAGSSSFPSSKGASCARRQAKEEKRWKEDQENEGAICLDGSSEASQQTSFWRKRGRMRGLDMNTHTLSLFASIGHARQRPRRGPRNDREIYWKSESSDESNES